ncbi:MAG: glycoside hydrolase family 99-like domain-containing protein [Kiritimatiellae bacterium]|nr:glycoside hydrolase family 99-like domain-containing protein [Kiritimatiellia bacterium]
MNGRAGALALAVVVAAAGGVAGERAPRIRLGAYYFDGWSGTNRLAGQPGEPWASNAPTHLTRSLATDYSDREPVWGWRSDTAAIMQRQIDLAADHGLSFWAFCWYFHPEPSAVAADPKHTGLRLYLAAPNRARMGFCLLVANHDSYQLRTLENWRSAAAHWVPLFREPGHVTLGGRPMVIVFNPSDALPEGLAAVEQAARAAGLPGVAWVGCAPRLPPVFAASTRYNVNGGWMKGWQEMPIERLYQLHRESWAGTPAQPHIPCVSVGWDRRPWETAAKGSWYYTGGMPDKFAAHLRELIAWMDAHPEQCTAERYAVVFAWNELGEGGWLVPTRGDPQGLWLRAIRDNLMQ